MEEEKINSWSALVCHQTALGVGGGVGGEQVRFMRVGQRDEGKTNGRKGRASVIVRGCGATK